MAAEDIIVDGLNQVTKPAVPAEQITTAVSPEVLDRLWKNMAIQLTSFNTAYVVAMPSAAYQLLDGGARTLLLQKFRKSTGFSGQMLRDATHVDRWLVGPIKAFENQIVSMNGIEVFVPANPFSESASDNGDQAKPRIRRPPNSYILYRKDHHEQVKAQNPGIHNNEISAIIGQMWRHESAGVKAMYNHRAVKLRDELLRLFPNYKYQPRKAGEKKKRAKRGGILVGEIVEVGSLDHTDLSAVSHEAANSVNHQTSLLTSEIIATQVSGTTQIAQANDVATFNAAQLTETEGMSASGAAQEYDDDSNESSGENSDEDMMSDS